MEDIEKELLDRLKNSQ